MKESDKEVRIWRSLVGAGLRKMRKKQNKIWRGVNNYGERLNIKVIWVVKGKWALQEIWDDTPDSRVVWREKYSEKLRK